jgi:hypothetical protein
MVLPLAAKYHAFVPNSGTNRYDILRVPRGVPGRELGAWSRQPPADELEKETCRVADGH